MTDGSDGLVSLSPCGPSPDECWLASRCENKF